MDFEFDTTGKVNVTNGSANVTGVDTNWVTNYPGVVLNIDGLDFPVKSINSKTSITLVHPYSGATASNKAYTIVPVHPGTNTAVRSMNTLIETINDLIENGGIGGGGTDGKSAYEIAVDNGFVGTEQQWLESLKGEDGEDGTGGGGQGAIINLNEYSGQPAGGSGISIIVPVAEGDPPMNLTQTAQVIIPHNTPDAGIAIWAKSTTSGFAVVMGLVNAPEPQPGGSGEELDLSGSGTVYGDPGSIFPLGIYLAGSSASFTLSAPSSFPLRIARKNNIFVPVASQWVTGGSGSPYAVSGDALSSSAVIYKRTYANGASDFRNGHLVLNKDTYLITDPLALDFGQSTNEALTQTPAKIKMSFKGIIPADKFPILGCLYSYNQGNFRFERHWSGNTLIVKLGRGPTEEEVVSDDGTALAIGTNQLLEVEWSNNANGEGGTVKFYVNGVQYGASKITSTKPRISPDMCFEVNSSGSNTQDSNDNIEVEHVGLSFDKPEVQTTYDVAPRGAILRGDLEALCVDATGFSTAQAPVTVTYTANGTMTYNLEVIVGEMTVPAGRAYKVVLEDWSSGSGVPHTRELVMTKPAAQNCKFEDTTLFGSQASWTEVLPKGPVPNINGINYYCEGIRMGNYVQLQFGYDWDAATMPNNPFGDPAGKESYMIPHKWLIYDSTGALLGRIEQPNGQPLNTTTSPACWSGSLDGRGVAIITANNKWYPKGTVRSGIIWRSHEPAAYSQQQIWNTVPTYDLAVPFASQTGYSVNGGDMRIFGSQGQINGFANYRWMPWESSTYTDMIAAGQNSLNPWKVGTNDISMTPNAGIWLKYTPFNQQGRSPITGPGGTRDDRQIMPEPVARYARDVTVKRLHDNRDMKQIALDYLTGYVSDPYHCFENGRLTPLFKGQPRRNITMRNHYYGEGEAGTPPEKAYYVQGGRPYEWATATNPLRVAVPFAGKTSDRPMFGTNMIDQDHAHQFPHWGSLMWQTPEFAMLGVKFMDQARLYLPWILNNEWDEAGEFASRGAAWKFSHAALAWKTASSNSTRLYSRADILDWVVFDFESFYDRYYASTPGFLNPPASITGSANNAIFAAAAHFGPCLYNGDYGVYQHDFMIGYWLSALHVAEKLGFNDALRQASPKAEAVVNWLITMHQKRITGKLNGGMLVNAIDIDYNTPIWTNAQISAAGGNVASLPKTFAAIATAQGANKAPSWDTWKSGSTVNGRDGQAMDQLLAGPSLLLDMGRTDPALTQAETAALGYRQSKIDSETAKGAAEAGSTWFQYLQTTNNPPYKPA